VIFIQKQPFDFAKELDVFSKKNKFSGAISSFLGKVRNVSNLQKIEEIFIENYEKMTKYQLSCIVAEAKNKWDIDDIIIIHRYGRLKIGENIVFIAIASKHREESLKSVEFIINWLKVRVTFWKKEISKNKSLWVKQKESDTKKIETT
tara:strand:- start:1189 stop:1632 length:444 start_codon:yes stop_codon:yes gene_type:complete